MIIDWNTIDTVMLDMDGTLLDLHYDNYFWHTHLPRRYCEIKGIEPESTGLESTGVESTGKELRQQIASLEGTLNWYCLEHWSEALAVDIGALKKEIREKIQERPHTQEFLQFLKEQQKVIALVTNAHPIGLDIKLDKTNIAPFFDHVISSHQFNHPKEVQEFWHSLQDHLPFDPERTLFIDDNPSVLASAKQFGIKHTLGIHQPDSQTPRQLDHIPSIHHFDEIMR